MNNSYIEPEIKSNRTLLTPLKTIENENQETVIIDDETDDDVVDVVPKQEVNIKIKMRQT